MCVEFVRRGAKVAMCGRSEEKLSALARELSSQGGQCIYRALDVSSAAQIQDFVRFAAERHGSIDVLVNNAGTANFGTFEDMTAEMIEKETRVNYVGPALLMKEVLPLLRSKGEGQVLNISSVCGYTPYPLLSSYSATKAALSALTQALQIELVGSRIGVINAYVGKLAGGLRFAPRPGSLHSIWERKSGEPGKAAASGMDPAVAARKIVAKAARGCKNIHTHPVGRIIYWFHPLALPVLRRLLYYAKLKTFQ